MDMELGLRDRTVVVTGGGSGIGAAVARGFGAVGAQVVVHFHGSRDGAEEVGRDIEAAGGRALVRQGDLTDRTAGDELFAAITREVGHVDVLVNNVGGLVERSPVAETNDELYDAYMEINFGSMFRACRAVVPVMNAGGAIINISSIAARNGGGAGSSLYCAGKGAVSSFTRALAKELAPQRIRVNAISPGIIETKFHEVTPPDAFAAMVSAIPLGRAGQPDEIVGPSLFLASEGMSSFVTGHVLEVNGGHVMG
jgi:3-oxoacyl-[acyl-carrier protein] reductase